MISYNLKGATYTRGSSTCTGGFGGGGCQDDDQTFGGGWRGSGYITYSSVMVQIVLELMAFKLLMEHLKWLRYLRINKKAFNLERF